MCVSDFCYNKKEQWIWSAWRERTSKCQFQNEVKIKSRTHQTKLGGDLNGMHSMAHAHNVSVDEYMHVKMILAINFVVYVFVYNHLFSTY